MMMADNTTNYAKDISNFLIETYGDKVKTFESTIPISARAAEISTAGVSILHTTRKEK